MHILLRGVVVAQSDPALKTRLAASLARDHKSSFAHLRAHLDPAAPGSAAAYAFLATLVKDCGEIDASAALLAVAAAQEPGSASYGLNLVHAYVVKALVLLLLLRSRAAAAATARYHYHCHSHAYQLTNEPTFPRRYEIAADPANAVAALAAFLKANGARTVGRKGGPACGDLLALVAPVCAALPGLPPAAAAPRRYRLRWVPDSHKDAFDGHVAVDAAGASAGARADDDAAEAPEKYSENDLDLLALFFAAVKLLFTIGALDAVVEVVAAVEPLRRRSKTALHTTTIRNEHAYYCCIAQLLAEDDRPQRDPAAGAALPRVYVCGDSHTLSPAWTTCALGGAEHVLHPALVTGLKHWHLRDEAVFYPKRNFERVVAKGIPDGASVVFAFGEIDCREGILVAVEKDRYPDVDTGMRATIAIFMRALKRLVAARKFVAYVHPVVPVLDETRHLVTRYNAHFKAAVKHAGTGVATWLDFFPGMLTPDGAKLEKRFHLDGTHVHPSVYTELFPPAFDAAVAERGGR